MESQSSIHESAGHRTRDTNLAATAEKVVLATSQDAARKRKGSRDEALPETSRVEPTSEEFLALLILLGPLAFVARWIWRCLLREDQEQQGKHYKTSHHEGQQLPGRGPDTVDAGTDHEHDEQEEERDQRRHVFFFPQRARAAAMRSSLLALRERSRRVVLASVRVQAADDALDVVLAHATAVVIAQ